MLYWCICPRDAGLLDTSISKLRLFPQEVQNLCSCAASDRLHSSTKVPAHLDHKVCSCSQFYMACRTLHISICIYYILLVVVLRQFKITMCFEIFPSPN